MRLESGANNMSAVTHSGTPLKRRYDVDWLRTLAMALLITYHVVLCFQPWAGIIGFPRNDPSLEGVWPFMAMVNIWRIPILFLVSGMGVRFAMEHRDWKQLLKDRTVRILLPYLFGIVGLQSLANIMMPYLGWDAEYEITFGHLWFLLNIFIYFSCFMGIMLYLKDKPDNGLFRFLSKVIRWPAGIFLFALPLMLEAWLVNPQYFSSYVDTVHGWLMGAICFFIGFTFISLGDVFWPAVMRIRWLALALAAPLFLLRVFVLEQDASFNWLIAFESMSWMLAVLGFSSRYLNRPSNRLRYFSRAVYPVYIIHLPIQFIAAYFLLPQSLPAYLKLALLLLCTYGFSLFLYEFVLRRLKWLRPLFGMKLTET